MTAGHEIDLAIEVQGPVISQATDEPKFGLDTTQARVNGRPVLSGSHVKGHLRQVFQEASAAGAPGIDDTWVARWFGKPSGNASEPRAGGFGPESGRLTVTDLAAGATDSGATTRIAIDESRGAVREGMMQIIETPWAFGERVVFEGRIRLQGITSESERLHLRESLHWAFQLIPAVGAFKTAGFGRIDKATFAEQWAALSASGMGCDAEAIANAGGGALRLEPHEPFLVWPHSHSGNFFVGDTTIPGQVLKAVAARWLADRGLLAGKENLLARLIFRHAYPVPANAPETPRPIAMPLSIYKVDDGGEPIFADALESSDDFREYAEAGGITFRPDWKTLPDVLSCYGPRAEPHRESRTRTAVKDNLAEDEKLFTHTAVDPAGCVWHGQILIPPDADEGDRQAMAALIAALAGTSLGLGKTKAAMDWMPVPLVERPAATRHASGWRVVLQTLACLHGPHATRSTKRDPAAALRADYEAYWSDVLCGTGFLVDFMARQRLAGGYLARRYPVTGHGYEPYLLTEPGSIFLIEERDSGVAAELADRLAGFVVTGLPLGPGWPTERHNWRYHPFLPEAGWGEVRISRESPISETRP